MQPLFKIDNLSIEKTNPLQAMQGVLLTFSVSFVKAQTLSDKDFSNLIKKFCSLIVFNNALSS